MKITRRQLNTLIENYLVNEKDSLNEAQFIDYEPPPLDQCNFKPNKEFFEFFTIMFTGKGTGRGIYDVDKGDLPTWISPAFTAMFTDAAGPLLNAYGLIPVFNQKGKCDLLQKLQDIFIKYKREYGEGIELNKETEKPETGKNVPLGAAAAAVDSGKIDINTVPGVVRTLLGKYGMRFPPSSDSSVLGRGTGAVTADETILATLILGSLENYPHKDAQEIHDNLFRLERQRKVNSSEIIKANKKLDKDQKNLLKRLLALRDMPEEKIIVKAMMNVIQKLANLSFFKK